MIRSANLYKKCLISLKNQAFFSQPEEVRSQSVKSDKAFLLSHAGCSPPFWHKESVRRFLFPECNHLIKLLSEAVFCKLSEP